MVAPEKIPGILHQAKKWVLRVLDPEHETKIRELETQNAALIEVNANLVENNRMVIDCIKSELKKYNLKIDAECCVIGEIGRSGNSGNHQYFDDHNIPSKASNFYLPEPSTPHGIFDDDDNLIELARKEYPKGGH